VAALELESAAREMDERTFRQEFKASFENQTEGLVYYAYDRSANIREAEFNPRLPVFWSLDFNVNPMCSVIGQRDGERVRVLDEIVLADSNTPAACDEFLRRTAGWKSQYHGAVQLDIYGDATGNGRASSASRTDWQIPARRPARTHVSDALGYMIASEFSMRSKGGYLPGILQ
jgi:hypothetical protein